MICESCQKRQIEIIEDCDDGMEPYKICRECHYRLMRRALRPIEWYNLASKHTYNKPLLHDDFYDDDGTACQPEIGVDMSELYIAPNLKEVSNDLDKLMDYALVKWRLEEEIIQALKLQDQDMLLIKLKQRCSISNNQFIKDRLYEIAYKTLEVYCEEWIRELWVNISLEHIVTLSHAAYFCLPKVEAYTLVTKAIDQLPEKELNSVAFSCLYIFRINENLSWIEANINKLASIDSIARLVATSNPNWDKMNQWIESGRPLSLLAITGISKMIPIDSEPFLKSLQPKPRLMGVIDAVQMIKVLDDYAQKDKVPRVINCVNKIKSSLDLII